MSFRWYTWSLLTLMPLGVIAQADEDLLIQQIIEFIAEQAEEEQDYSELTERLHFYRKRPMNINVATDSELAELVFISAVQIRNLLEHREHNGPLLDMLELQSIDGFDEESIRWLMNFAVVNPPGLLAAGKAGRLMADANHDLMLRFGRILEGQAGYARDGAAAAAYSGSADRVFTRYRFNYQNRVSAALNMEKDAGEPFLKHSGRGFDFYSANVMLSGQRVLQKLIMGDYALQFGQGLTMWSGLSFGKGAAVQTIARQALGLRPNSSVNETSFLRGLAATLNLRKITFTPFISYKKLDASLADPGQISSLQVSGLHRTSSERGNKNRVSQFVYGINSGFRGNKLKAGFTAYRMQLDMPLVRENSMVDRYDFAGHSVSNIGLHYTYTLKNTYFFGEAAHSLASGSAFLQGLMSSLSSRVSLVLSYRNYAADYYSFFNQAQSESAEARNERGFYSGLWLKFSKQLELYSYFDAFRFPWLKFRVHAPSQGYEWYTQLSYSPNKRFKLSARLKRQVKEENASATGVLQPVLKQNYRLELSYHAGRSFVFRSRAELAEYTKGGQGREYGFLNYQDIIYNPLSSRFSGNIRFALFDTPSFNSRIYAYENDVLYGYSVPAFQGNGLRWYVNGRYTLRRGLDVWLRYAQLNFARQKTVGSGNDLISGNQRSDIKLQLRLQF